MSKMGKIVAYVILAICIVVFLVGACFLVDILIEYNKADDFYGNIGGETLPMDSETEAYIAERLQFFNELKMQYPNIVGYVNIPAVSIAYPVVQGSDNEYYTTHLISGEESPVGSIFLDYRIDKSPAEAKNFVLYGHSMNNRSMFYNVRSLFDADTFADAEVEYICDDGVYIYESFSVYVTTTADPYYAYAFADDVDFSDFLAARFEKTRFVNVKDFDEDSRVITLVTCTNSISDPEERYIYHGILKEHYEVSAE